MITVKGSTYLEYTFIHSIHIQRSISGQLGNKLLTLSGPYNLHVFVPIRSHLGVCKETNVQRKEKKSKNSSSVWLNSSDSLAVAFNGKSPAPVWLCVDRWALRGYHRLSSSHLMRPQRLERKNLFLNYLFCSVSLPHIAVHLSIMQT